MKKQKKTSHIAMPKNYSDCNKALLPGKSFKAFIASVRPSTFCIVVKKQVVCYSFLSKDKNGSFVKSKR